MNSRWIRILLTSVALAGMCRPSLANWNGAQSLTAIYPQNVTADILIQQPGYSGTGCAGEYGKYFRLPQDHPNYRSIYALLLSAFHASQPVNIYLKNGACDSNGYSEISLVILGTWN